MERNRKLLTAALAAALLGQVVPVHATEQNGRDASPPHARTPIEHVIVVVGENHTFDNLFGGYQPPRGQKISNLLSKGIINEDGTPGPNFALAAQQQASDTDVYRLSPAQTGPFASLPQPNTTYATGEPPNVADPRFPSDLTNGPFQITKYVSYDAHTGDPVHRFFQMWQQYDRGHQDLFAWVATTASAGPSNGATGPTPGNPHQGGESMGFYNMSTGDAPDFRAMARRYAIGDNYHQAIMGGTGANFIALVTADAAYYNENGTPQVPPSNQIENPNPQLGLNNWYTEDGYRGGSYVNCADENRPGVAMIRSYLRSLPYSAFRDGNCAADTYYLLNNYGLGYSYAGTPSTLGPNNFTLPPQTVPTIADALSANGVSWKYYSGGRQANGAPTSEYCGICDPLTGFTSIMTTSLKDNLQGLEQFYQDVAGGTLPAVAIAVSPYAKKGYVDHTYYDHASIIKFIEKNWSLAPLSPRSRDNLPDPVARRDNPYVPANAPAIGDLMNLFDFGHLRGGAPAIGG